jgi:hypothetical protein
MIPDLLELRYWKIYHYRPSCPRRLYPNRQLHQWLLNRHLRELKLPLLNLGDQSVRLPDLMSKYHLVLRSARYQLLRCPRLHRRNDPPLSSHRQLWRSLKLRILPLWNLQIYRSRLSLMTRIRSDQSRYPKRRVILSPPPHLL